MKIFLSWSGEQSRCIAEVIKRWLPVLFPEVEVYFSPNDISKGSRWGMEIARELEASRIGLIILTRENISAPWVMFEAGALSKNLDKSKVIPLLFGIDSSDIQGPLVQFQSSLFEENDINKVMKTINDELGDKSRPVNGLDEAFDVLWPNLEKNVQEIIVRHGSSETSDIRSERNILEEILALSRSISQPPDSIINEIKILYNEIQDIKSFSFEIKRLSDDIRSGKLLLEKDSADCLINKVSGKENCSEEVHEEENEENSEDVVKDIMDWLSDHNILIKSCNQPESVDIVFNELSEYLGEKYDTLVKLHDAIKRNLTSGNGFYLNLSSRPSNEINNATHFCSKLKEYALLASYKYDKYTKSIYAVPQRNGRTINFFTGGWFVRFVHIKIISLLQRNDLSYSFLRDAQMLLANEYDFHLDLFYLVDDNPLWIECRTGEYSNYITRLSKIRRMLGVSPDRSILIVLDVPDELTKKISDLHEISVANQNNFIQVVQNSLGLHVDKTDESFMIGNGMVQSPLLTFLNKSGLRPLPEYRKSVISLIIKEMDGVDEDKAESDFKVLMKNKIGISRSQLHDIFNALYRSVCFVDKDGGSVNYTPFRGFFSNNSDEVEERVVLYYAHTVLCWKIDYFDNTENYIEFSRIVGSNLLNEQRVIDIKDNIEKARFDAARDLGTS